MTNREEIARIIYDAFPFEPRHGEAHKPAWVDGGNSFRQYDARRAADAIIALSAQSSPAPARGSLNSGESDPRVPADSGAGEAIFEECAEIAMEHVGGAHDDPDYDQACRDIAEAIRLRAANRKTMDAIADTKVIELQRQNTELVKALEAISAVPPIETGAERLRCRQCGHAWLPDEQERHGKHCAYQIARAALALMKP